MKTIEAEEISTIPKSEANNPKTTRLEILDRIGTVMDLLSSGYTTYQIWRNNAHWGVKQSQVANYVRHCKKKIEAQQDTNFNKIRSWHIEKHRFIYRQFVQEKDWRGAVVVLGRLEELEGIKQGDIFPVSPAEEKKRLERVKNELFKMNPKLIARPEGASSFEVS